LATGKPIELYGDGSTSRDYTWIDDIIDGVVASVDEQIESPSSLFRIYNLGGSRATSLKQLVSLISASLGLEPQIIRKPEQPGDMKHTHADVSFAAEKLGYCPKVAIDEGIPRFVDWWKEAYQAEVEAAARVRRPSKTMPYSSP
jgi:UDP-glucuronate 4-epimerase